MVAWTVCKYVNLVLSTEDLRLEGEEVGPQAQAPVVSNLAIHHSDKPFIDFRRRSGHGSTIFGDMIWIILHSSFKLTPKIPLHPPPNKTSFFRVGRRNLGQGGVQ